MRPFWRMTDKRVQHTAPSSTDSSARMTASAVMSVDERRRRRGLPFRGEDAPQELIEVLAVLEEGTAEASFGRGPELPQRGVAARVVDHGAGFEPVDADLREGEL